MFAATKLSSGVLNDFVSYVDLGITGIKQLHWRNYAAGTRAYVVNSSGINSITFSGMSTNNLAGAVVDDTLSLSNASGAFYRDAGTAFYLYTLDTTSNKVKEYTLTSGILSTATATGKEFSVATQTTSGYNLQFSLDGKIMLIQDGTNVRRYDLSTAWDLSTASYSSATSSLNGTSASNSVSVYDSSGNNTSGYAYLAISGNINKYNVSPTYTLSSASLNKQITAKELTGGSSSIISVSAAKVGYVLAGNTNGKIYLFKD